MPPLPLGTCHRHPSLEPPRIPRFGSGAPSRFVEHIIGGKLDALRHDLPELDELDNLFAPEVR